VPHDVVLSKVYGKSFHCAIESLALFLAQHFGGPRDYSKGRWWMSLYEAHLRFAIGQRERDAWVKNMTAALDEVGITGPARAQMAEFFEQASTYLINRPKTIPETGVLVCDDAIAALRRGDLERVEELAGHPEFGRDRAAWVSLLAEMAATDAPRVRDYALAKIAAEPGLAREPYSRGRTLLHAAAGEGCLAMVELLLRLGADPNTVDGYGHPPLYFVGNGCRRESGPAVVRALVEAGANVNQQDRVKRCTPLHMAARRGNVAVARAMLECGADPGIRDIAGVTPLQRAINCRKPAVASLLSASFRLPRSV